MQDLVCRMLLRGSPNNRGISMVESPAKACRNHEEREDPSHEITNKEKIDPFHELWTGYE